MREGVESTSPGGATLLLVPIENDADDDHSSTDNVAAASMIATPTSQQELQRSDELVEIGPSMPLIPPRQEPTRHGTERSSQVVRTAETALVRSSDSVLSQTSSEEEDDDDDVEDDEGYRHLPTTGSQKKRKQPRASSIQYMQDASIEVTVSGAQDHHDEASLDDSATKELKMEEDASWNEVRFHESLIGQFHAMDVTTTESQRRKSRSSSLVRSTQNNNNPHARISIPIPVAPQSTIEALAAFDILKEDGLIPCCTDDKDLELLYRILLPFAKTFRCESALQPLLDIVLPTTGPRDWSGLPVKGNTSPAPSLDPVIRLFTAGYPKQPALFKCSIQFAVAMVRSVVQILASSTDSILAQSPLKVTLGPQVLYASARFQSNRLWNAMPETALAPRPALTVVWDLWLHATSSNALSSLADPLLQLLVLLGMAGVTPQFLQTMLRHVTSSTVDASNRWSLIRALTFMADGAAGRTTGPLALTVTGPESLELRASYSNRPLPPQRSRSRSGSEDVVVLGAPPSSIPSPTMTQESFFIWTGRPEGWKRKIAGLASWPFRNDFGMAVWFRADHLDPSRYPVLMSYRSDTGATGGGGGGGGVDVSLVPLGRGTGTEACTIQVSVYDFDKPVPTQTLHVPGCVLLGNVWYHLAVRHSNARLKGVFSLSSRQQISILVNGKVILQQPLVFPKICSTESIHDHKKTEATILPAMVRAAAAAARRPSASGGSGMFSCTLTLCSDFEGQTSALYVFNDSVSDASFRALYQVTGGHVHSSGGGNGAILLSRISSSSKDRWDSRKSDIVKRSRVLDVNIMNDDAEEVVLSQRRIAVESRQKRNAAVLDVVSSGPSAAGEEDAFVHSYHSQQDDETSGAIGSELLKPSCFGTKVFLVWDPRRVVDDIAVEVHLGAHLTLNDGAFCWTTSPPQDALQSLGGPQSLIPVFHGLLEGCSALPDILSHLLDLLRSFVCDHDGNARELLRCGGIDVVESLILKNFKQIMKPVNTSMDSASLLVHSLLELRAACAHYVGLETKVFSRLLFNLPLWCSSPTSDLLQEVLLPVLSSLSRDFAGKVRDCVGTRDMAYMLFTLRSYTEESINEGSHDLSRASDFLVGMIFDVLSSGARPLDIAPLVCGLAQALDQFTIQSTTNEKLKMAQLDLAKKSSCALLFLLQIRPTIPGLYESFAHCCGSAQSMIAWILCAMVKSSHDEIRSIGVRCAAECLDVTSNGADNPLALGHFGEGTDANPSGDVESSVVRFGRMAKGLTGVGSSVGIALATSSRQTPRVVMKLLWHLLKSNRSDLGDLTNAALTFCISDDGGIVSNSLMSREYVLTHLIKESGTRQPGYHFCLSWAENILAETGSIVGRSMKRPLVLGTVLRLLRYLNGEAQDRWLTNLLVMSKASRKSTNLLSSLPDWQPSLFHLISETLELLQNVASRCEVSTATVLSSNSLGDPKSALKTSEEMKLTLASVSKRLDLGLDLYSTLLGHLVREGGDKSLEAVEKAVSLQRICVNGQYVMFLVLSGLCSNLFDFGTILDMGSISAQDWKGVDIVNDSLPLKQSSRLVTDAILSNGTKGLDMPTAVKSWRSLRHLSGVISAVAVTCGFGVVDLFDYNYRQATSVDFVSGGLHGIRLPESRVSSISSSTFLRFVAPSRSDGADEGADGRRDVDRRFCAHLSSQILALLDPFVFPEALDEVLPASQLHGLALVRNSEPRLGSVQGPLVATAIRLSLVLIALLEPGSVKLLQCASRMRCLVVWALELVRERKSADLKSKSVDDASDRLDHLLVATLVHCHRALGRCSALMSEIESTPFERYFESRDLHKKYHRRLVRTGLEFRDVVLTIYRGRLEMLRTFLSLSAFEALRDSLEGQSQPAISKEAVVKDFLSSIWVAGFQDVEIKLDVAVPEQLSMGNIPLSSDQVSQSDGFSLVQELAAESRLIGAGFEKTLSGCFEQYLEETRKWAETDAVRDLEFEGDSTCKLLTDKFKADSVELARSAQLRNTGAENRWIRIHRTVVEPWEGQRHWTLSRYTDGSGRRTLLVPNRNFLDHNGASYELMMEMEREKADRVRMARLAEADLAEVMRRHAEAFTVHEPSESHDGRDDESSVLHPSDGESSEVESTSEVRSEDGAQAARTDDEGEHDEDWDRIENDEFHLVNADKDIDAWAKLFIWSDGESFMGRFDNVVIVSLQTTVEGRFILTTHGLYFQQTEAEVSVITKGAAEVGGSGSSDTKYRRWRLARLTEIHGRRYMLRHQALELFFADRQELFVNFTIGPMERDRFYAKVRNSCKVPMLGSLKSLNPKTVYRKTRLTELWQQRRITNFDYLMALNRMAGRSFNDISQYPVFPWVLSDYTSESIDLNDSSVYRDLTKPIGALNPDRLAQLLERYRDLELFGFSEAERFLYGSHYSSPGIVLHYLIRQEPFTSMAIELQSGRFDCPDRLFFDFAGSWNGCLTSSSDVKELIPEFFCLPEMFLNTSGFPLGRTQAGKSVDSVILPPWAKGSAYEFVRIHKLALESEYVSQNLHHWIDLIFGYQQRGPEAEAAHNLFHHLSYEGAVDLDKIVDELDRQAAESHIQNFGQTPSQLIVAEPHPCRLPAADCWKPLVHNLSVPRNLRCYTPSKQFGNKGGELGNGAVLKLHVFSETLLAVYEDMSVGLYRWFPTSKSNRLRMEKLRPLPRRELSASRAAIKRGSTIPPHKLTESSRCVGNWSFAATIGGSAKEQLRRKALYPPSSRLIASNDSTLASAEGSGFLISCGYWDNTIKVHAIESLRVVASESGGHRGAIRCFAEHDGLIATGGDDATCRLWVIAYSDMAVALSDGYTQTALGSPNDGDQLLSCCRVLWGHSEAIMAIAVNSSLDAVVSGSQAGLVCVHTIRRGEFLRSFKPPSVADAENASAGAVRKIALDSFGNLVLHMHDLGLHSYTVNAVRLSTVHAGERLLDMLICSCGEILVTGGMNCQVMIRSVSNLHVLSMLDLSRHGPIQCLGITPDDLNPTKQFLFVGSDDGMVTIIDEDPAHYGRSSATFS